MSPSILISKCGVTESVRKKTTSPGEARLTVSDEDRLQVDGRHVSCGSERVPIVDSTRVHRQVPSSVGLATRVELPSLELGEGLEELSRRARWARSALRRVARAQSDGATYDGHECLDIDGRLISARLDRLAVLRETESDASGLQSNKAGTGRRVRIRLLAMQLEIGEVGLEPRTRELLLTWSMTKMFARLFHESGLYTRSFLAGSIRHGPSSVNSPYADEDPGPPLVLHSDGMGSEACQLESSAFSRWKTADPVAAFCLERGDF